MAALDFFRDVDVVITSGGLGPTADDLTADVVASWVGASMELDPALEERIWAIVTRLRARVGGEEAAMRAGARKQAHVPAGAAVLEPAGTAPGFILGSSPMVVVLPGPPRELQSMWADAVTTEPLRGLLAGAGELEQRILRFFPLPEPQIAATLREIDAASLPLEVTTCLRRGELELATVFTPDAASAYESFEAALRERHGDVLFSDDGATIDEVVVAAPRRPDAGDRGVLHGRADGGPADRPRRLLRVRAGWPRRLLQRGQDGARGSRRRA